MRRNGSPGNGLARISASCLSHGINTYQRNTRASFQFRFRLLHNRTSKDHHKSADHRRMHHSTEGTHWRTLVQHIRHRQSMGNRQK